MRVSIKYNSEQRGKLQDKKDTPWWDKIQVDFKIETRFYS